MGTKTYKSPAIKIEQLGCEKLLCGSVTSSGDWDIGYGGVDKDGTVVAGTRRYDAWDGDPIFRDDSWAE